MALLQVVNIHEHHQNAINLAFRRQEREHTDRVPSAILGLDLAPHFTRPLQDLRDRFIQIRKVDADADMADRAADVTREQVKQLLRLRGKAADALARLPESQSGYLRQ